MKKAIILAFTFLTFISCSDQKEQDMPKSANWMPIIRIETENGCGIESRETYVKADFRIEEKGEILAQIEGKIRGRGNSSWWNADKKSYRLKFNEKTSLLDRPADKSWCLIANFFDKTMIRNALAFKMSDMSKLDYTPDWDYVEVYLNGSYEGVYLLCDVVKTSSSRVNADYLLEVDSRAEEQNEDIYFKVPHTNYIVVKDPDDASGETLTYITEFVGSFDDALFSSGYLDGETGYRKYIDIDSFVDWYVINEIARNNDAVMHTSCFMHQSVGGKLIMGPVWDFDIGFGNTTYNGNMEPYGLWVSRSDWFSRMLTDPAFLKKVKERFSYFYGKREELYDFIDNEAAELAVYIEKDDRRWHSLSELQWSNPVVHDSYSEYISDLKTWLERRFEWMNTYYTQN